MDFLRRIKLRNKIFLLCAVLVLVTTVLIQASSWWTSNRFNQKQLQQQIDNAEAVLTQYLSAQEALLVTTAKVLAADFGFIRAVATSESKTIQSVLENHANRIAADVMALTDMSGNVLSSTTDDLSLKNALGEGAVQTLIANPAKAIFVTLENRLYQLILIPVKAPHTIAYTIMGFEIAQDNVVDLKKLTGLEISFFQGDKHLLSSTIRSQSFESFRDALDRQQSSWLFIKRPAFLTQAIALESAMETPVSVLLISSLAPLYKQYDEILLNNTSLALIVALIASLLSIIFARSLTVPLLKLASVADAYAKGHYMKSVEINGGEEVSKLQRAFRDMGQEIKQREDEISYQAKHDIRTGLPNLQTVRAILKEHLKSGVRVILIAINIHNFRQINDRLGADVADACLQALAERLKSMNMDMLCSGRLEGAEFFSAIYLDDSKTPMTVVDDYLSELESAFTVADLHIKLDISAGVTLYPENGTHADTMLRRTSIALDAARKDKQRIHCYEDGEDEMHLQRLAMMESLRKIILADGGDGELFMVYQPKVHLDGFDDIRTEALIRWRRENNSFVSPELFVNLAEEASLIVDLTHWVFESVLKQLSKWHSEGSMLGSAINVSAQDLAHQEFETFVMACCQRHGVAPKYVTIEITERDIMHDEAAVVMALRNLKKHGFTVAIDDYGIGQSSLSKLKGLPVDEIKLDKSFIMHLNQSPKDQLIVRSTIEMAHGLGFQVVAEGVENNESLDLLKQFQCDQVQGYYISKPIAADAVTEWRRNYVEEPSQMRTIIRSQYSQRS